MKSIVTKLRLKPPRGRIPLPREGERVGVRGQAVRRLTLTLTLSLKGERNTCSNRYDVAARRCLVVLMLTVASPLAAQSAEPRDTTAVANAAGQKGKGEKQGRSRVRFVMGNHPSLRAGDALRVDFRVKLHGDFRAFSPDLATDEGLFDPNRRRLGIEGTLLKHFEYQLERELRQDNPWRDVFMNFRYFDNVQIQGGKFKIPFGLDELTSEMNLDFVYRSRLADDLAPGRDIGVTAHGRFFRRGLGYEAGAFKRAGEHERFGPNPGGGRTVAGRLMARPFRLSAAPAAVRELEVAVDATAGDVTEGPYALRGRMVSGAPYFGGVYVNGRRVRVGVDANWTPGPVSVRGEFLRLRDERRDEGFGESADLPPLISQGWYVSSTWAVTGEPEAQGIEPKRPLFQGGVGAVELAARYERIVFGSSAPGEPPSRSPRAAKVLESGDRVWTLGVNWYLNRWARIQLNAVRESLEDADRSPIMGRTTFWTRVCRLQFVL